MRAILKDGFFWRFAGGFVLGAIGLVILQPADATVLAHDLASMVHAIR